MKGAELIFNGKKLTGIKIADSYFLRLRGLIGRDVEAIGGLWIKPCSQIHMFFMKYPIDVIYLSRELEVLKIGRALEINKAYPKVRGCRSVIELPAGAAERFGICEKSRVEIKKLDKI